MQYNAAREEKSACPPPLLITVQQSFPERIPRVENSSHHRVSSSLCLTASWQVDRYSG